MSGRPIAPLVTPSTPVDTLRTIRADMAIRAGAFPDARTALEAVDSLIGIRTRPVAEGFICQTCASRDWHECLAETLDQDGLAPCKWIAAGDADV